MTERRAPTQASIYVPRPDGTTGQGCALRPHGSRGSVAGSISWAEHELAWREYARQCGHSQSAERLAERGGFDWWELLLFLGREPESWEPTG